MHARFTDARLQLAVCSSSFSPMYRSMSGVGGMAAANAAGTGGTYGLAYMTGSPTELTASPQQLWNAQGKFVEWHNVLEPRVAETQ